MVLTISQADYVDELAATFLDRAGKTKLRKVLTPLPREQPPPADYEQEGVLHFCAAEMIGALLWVARCTRPDISFAVAFLARFVGAERWCTVADRYLERIVAYLAATRDHVLVMWLAVGDTLFVKTFADADHAGCPFSGRSTSGACTFLAGPRGSYALVAWAAKRQGCAAASTGEAEMVSISEATRKQTMPIVRLLEQIFGRAVAATMLTDSSAAAAAIEKGSSAAMRYLRKNQRVSMSCLKDYFTAGGVEVEKIDGERNLADIFTKPLDGRRFEEKRFDRTF